MKGCRPFTDAEIEAITASFSGRYAARNRALFILGLKTGFRICEMLSLRIADVASTNGKAGEPSLPGFLIDLSHMFDRISVSREHSKGSFEGQTVVLHRAAQAALDKWIAELRAMGYTSGRTPLFLSQVRDHDGKTPSPGLRPISYMQANRILHAACEACGVGGQLGTHCMRKTFARKMYEKFDGNLFDTKQAMRHHSVDSTIQYLSSEQKKIDDAIRST